MRGIRPAEFRREGDPRLVGAGDPEDGVPGGAAIARGAAGLGFLGANIGFEGGPLGVGKGGPGVGGGLVEGEHKHIRPWIEQA